MNRKRLRKTVYASMFCALIFAATQISIPTPTVGNVNLGDAMLLLCAWMLGGAHAILAAAIGSALTDLLGAYAIYAPATLLIKGLMVASVLLVLRLTRRAHPYLSRFLSAIVAELIMILGYFLYEATVLSYGLGALANVPFNAVQGACGILLAMLSYGLLSHIGIKIE